MEEMKVNGDMQQLAGGLTCRDRCVHTDRRQAGRSTPHQGAGYEKGEKQPTRRRTPNNRQRVEKHGEATNSKQAHRGIKGQENDREARVADRAR